MNQREAIVTMIDFVRDREGEGGLPKPVAKALKVLEKRSEILLARHERRFAPLPEDLDSEPMTLTTRRIYQDLLSVSCRACGKRKSQRQSLCVSCYVKLDGSSRKALCRQAQYDSAYCRALRLLGWIPSPENLCE